MQEIMGIMAIYIPYRKDKLDTQNLQYTIKNMIYINIAMICLIILFIWLIYTYFRVNMKKIKNINNVALIILVFPSLICLFIVLGLFFYR